MVFDVEDYNYIKDLQLKWSYERGVKLSIEAVLSEIVGSHRAAKEAIEQRKVKINETIETLKDTIRLLDESENIAAFQAQIEKLEFLKTHL